MELGSATFACSITEESNSSNTLSSCSASPAHHEQMITLMHNTKVFNKGSAEGPNNVIKGEDSTTPSTQGTSSCMTQSPYTKCGPLNWFPRKRTESYLERKIRMLQEKEGMNATLDETLGDSNPHLPRIEREKLAAQTAARVAMEARKAALVETSWCRILKAARIQSTLAEIQLKKAEQKAAEAFDSATAVRVIIDNNPGGSKQSLEFETSTTDGSSTHTVSTSFETAFEVDKEVAEAVKVAFFRLADLPSSSIKDIFDARKRESINLDDNAVKLNNDSDSKDFSSEACSESEAHTEGEHQTDSELERDAVAIAPETNCIQIRKNAGESKTNRHRSKHHQSNRQPAKEIIVSEELIDLMLGRVKLLKEEELVSLAMIVATRGLSAMLREDNKEQELNGKCSSGGLGDILLKHVSRLEAEKAAAVAAASKAVAMPGDNRRELTSESLADLGSILVKHVSKFEREVEEAKKMAKAIKSEDNTNLRELQEQDGRTSVKHAELMIHVSEKPAKLAESEQQDAENLDAILVEKIHLSEREQLTATGEKCRKMPQPKSGLSKKQSMEIDVNPVDDIDSDYDKENKDMNICSTNNKTLEMKSKFDMLNTNNLEKIQKSNFTYTLSGSDLSTIPAKLEQEILAVKNASDVVEQVQRKKNHHNENSEEGLDKILVKHISKLEKEKLAAVALSNEASTGVQRTKQHHYVNDEDSLDKVLIKHISKLEKEKMAAPALTTNSLQDVDRKYQLQDTVEESLDKVLVKHISKLEKEKLVALALEKEPFQRVQRNQNHCDRKDGESLQNVLVKHISKLEKAKMEAVQEASERVQKNQHECDGKNEDSLDKVLVKHVSRLEREKKMAATQEAFHWVQKDQHECDGKKEDSLDKVLVKHVSRLEREKKMAAAQEAFPRVQRKQRQNDEDSIESLDKILVKHLSQLEKEKQRASTKGSEILPQSSMSETRVGSLTQGASIVSPIAIRQTKQTNISLPFIGQDQAVQPSQSDPFGPMVEEMPRIEIEKQQTTMANLAGASILQRHRNARAQEIQEAWGGFSLGNSLRRHMSQLEIDKAAWHRAEEEARIRASQY